MYFSTGISLTLEQWITLKECTGEIDNAITEHY